MAQFVQRSLLSCKNAMKVFILFVFILVLSSTVSASLIDQGCSHHFQRLNVNIGEQKIKCGESYDLNDVGRNIPSVEYSTAIKNKLYTVVMIDPDAPSNKNPVARSWLHYLAVNVKGGDLKVGVSLQSDLITIIMEYNPPTPPEGSGLHRYIIYIMKQDSSSHVTKGSIHTRNSFDIDKFVKDNNLDKPVASNMFETKTEK